MIKSYDRILNEGFSKYFKRLEESIQTIYDEYRNMTKEPVIEFPNGDYFYVVVDPETKSIYAGSATNTGVFREYEIEVDEDGTLDSNLEALYDYMIEDNPELTMSAEDIENTNAYYDELMGESCKSKKGKKKLKESDEPEFNDYSIEIEFAGMIGVSNEYTEYSTSEQGAIEDAISDATDDLEVEDVKDNGDGTYTVSISFCGYYGSEEEYEVDADDPESAEYEAIEMAKEDLEVVDIKILDDEDLDESLEDTNKKLMDWGKSMYGGWFVNYHVEGKGHDGKSFKTIGELRKWCKENGLEPTKQKRRDNDK